MNEWEDKIRDEINKILILKYDTRWTLMVTDLIKREIKEAVGEVIIDRLHGEDNRNEVLSDRNIKE